MNLRITRNSARWGAMMMSNGEIMGWSMLLLGLVANFCETWYFGWNITPESAQELAADIVCAIICVVGVIVMMIARLR